MKWDQVVRFEGDTMFISRPGKYEGEVAVTPKPGDEDEIANVYWSWGGGGYPTNSTLGQLHRYIARKWYGDDVFLRLTKEGNIVEHIDNDPLNCRISNLYFLNRGRNTAKGLTIDKEMINPLYLSWKVYRDFSEGVFQMHLWFNCEARLILGEEEKKAVVDHAVLLWDCDYESILHDIDGILLDYRKRQEFRLNALHCSDYHVGRQGDVRSFDFYEERLSAQFSSAGPVVSMMASDIIPGLSIGSLERLVKIRPKAF